MKKLVLFALLPVAAFAQRAGDVMHRLEGRVDFEPIQAVEAAMTKTRIQRAWGIKVGYLALGDDGVHFYHRRSPEHFFVAYDDITELDLISKRRILIESPEGSRYFEVHKDYVTDVMNTISEGMNQNSARNR